MKSVAGWEGRIVPGVQKGDKDYDEIPILCFSYHPYDLADHRMRAGCSASSGCDHSDGACTSCTNRNATGCDPNAGTRHCYTNPDSAPGRASAGAGVGGPVRETRRVGGILDGRNAATVRHEG